MARLKVYALSTCPYCKQARAFLTDNGVEFDVVEVDKLMGAERDQAVAEVKELSGGTSFPVLTKDGAVVVGYDRGGIMKLAGLS